MVKLSKMKLSDIFDQKLKLSIKNWLKKIDFLIDIPEKYLEEIVNALEIKKIDTNQTPILQGMITNNFYLIQKGSFDVIIKTKTKSEKIAELKAGDYFGEISLLEPTTATATVKAKEPSILYILSGDDFNKILEDNPRILQILKNKIALRKEQISKKQLWDKYYDRSIYPTNLFRFSKAGFKIT